MRGEMDPDNELSYKHKIPISGDMRGMPPLKLLETNQTTLELSNTFDMSPCCLADRNIQVE